MSMSENKYIGRVHAPLTGSDGAVFSMNVDGETYTFPMPPHALYIRPFITDISFGVEFQVAAGEVVKEERRRTARS